MATVDVGTLIANAEGRGLSLTAAASSTLEAATQAISVLYDSGYLDALTKLPLTKMPTWIPLNLPAQPALEKIEIPDLQDAPTKPTVQGIDGAINAGGMPSMELGAPPTITPPRIPNELRAFDVKPPDVDLDAITLPSAPSIDVSITAPTKPAALAARPSSRDVNTNFQAGPMPTRPSQPVPNIQEPTRPTETRAFSLQAPSIDTSWSSRLPTPPSAFSGAIPTIGQIDLPQKPSISMPTFTGTMPADIGAPPDVSRVVQGTYRDMQPVMVEALNGQVEVWIQKFNPEYHAQMSRLEQRLHELSSGETETGFKPHVEDAIYGRARSKISAEAMRATSEAAGAMAGRGFTLPNGALFAAMNQARRSGNDQLAGTGREIVIKQAEMLQNNIQFAITQSANIRTTMMQGALNYFGALIQLNGQVVNMAQAVVESMVKAHDMIVRTYTAKLDAYKAEVSVYETLIRATTATIDIYKAEIEGEKAKVDVDVARIQAYREQVNAHQSQVSVYQAQVQAVITAAELEKLKIAAFEAETRAYSAEVQAKQGEWQAYSSAWGGEEAKIRAYIATNQVYQTELEAHKVAIQSESARIDAEIKGKEAELRAYTAEVEAKRAEWQGFTAEWSGEEIKMRAQQAQVDAYGKAVQAAISAAELEKLKVSVFESQVRAFSVEVEAKRAEWGGFTAAWSGEEAKVKSFLAIADVYKTQLQAFQAKVQAEGTRVDAQAKAVEAQLRGYSAEVQAYGEEVRAGSQYVAAQATVQDAKLKAHQLQSQAAIEQAKTNAERFKAEVHAELEHKRLLMQGLLEQARLFVKGMESIASVHSSVGNSYAQMAGSALSGMNTLVTAEQQ